MALMQGLSGIVFRVAWVAQLRTLHPDPSSYQAYMGLVQAGIGGARGIRTPPSGWTFWS